MRGATQVLIVGAGPTGLALGLWLARLGIGVRIVDKAAAPGTTSRALAVHARILEFYDQIGLAQDIVERGLKMTGANLWVGGVKKARMEFGDMGRGLSPFPYALIFPQDEHERLLIDRLAALGVTVERPVELVDFRGDGADLTARLRRADGTEEQIACRFIAGCDGAHSRVREVLGVGFPGGTYSRLFYVADVEASGPAMNRELNAALDEAEFLAIFPLKAAGQARFIGTIKREAELGDRHDLSFADVSHHLIKRLALNVERVNWFSAYRVHHRVARRFGTGHAFLLGDAAHIHSPVGGQGMNTGIGDAVNLAWKLAAVLKDRADRRLLDTYEPERIAFAHRLVASTDRAFQFISQDGPVARFVRMRLVPLLLPPLFGLAAVRRLMFRTISQTNINYRGSASSGDAAGKLQSGDRLPWLPMADGGDNFASLRRLDWQAHVYGDPPAETVATCTAAGLSLYRFPWIAAAERAGIVRGAVYLVRPDGYIAMSAHDNIAATLRDYQARFALVFAPTPR